MRFPYILRLLLLAAVACCLLPPSAALAQATATPQEITQLLNDLAGSDLAVQEQAAQRLAELAPPEAVPQLVRIFATSSNPRPVAAVLAAIGTPAAFDALVRPLGDQQLTARRNAAQVALLSAGDAAVPALTASLQATNTSARRNAAQMLGYIGSRQGINALLRTVNRDAQPSVRREAVWALGEIGSTNVRPALKAVARTDPDPDVRLEAEQAVLRLGDEF